MNIQIFGSKKDNDTKKAQRFFKERGIRFQYIALALVTYIAEEDKLDKILENPQILKIPIVRNGRQATLGYQPDVWKTWE